MFQGGLGGHVYSMCRLGVVWKVEAPDAAIAFSQRGAFIDAIRNHDGPRTDEDAARSIYAELLGNVMRHGKSPVSVWLECCGPRLQFHLVESGQGFTRKPALPNAHQEGGRGLFLVSTLASELTIEGEPPGTHIVATLPAQDENP